MCLSEFPWWLSGLRPRHGVHEDADLIPTLAQWVKDLALPWAVAQVADVAWIWSCYSHNIGWQLQLQIEAWELPYATGVALKRKKNSHKSQGKTKNLFQTEGDKEDISKQHVWFRWGLFEIKDMIRTGRGDWKGSEDQMAVTYWH